MSGGTVALLESRAQARAALALVPRPDAFVPLSPEAAAALEEAGVPYTAPESFYNEAALCARGDEVLDSQIAWARWIDAWIRERRPDLDLAFEPARWHLFHLKRLFDALLYRAQALEGIRAGLSPTRVIYFSSEEPLAACWPLEFKGSLNSLCVPLWAAQRGIAVEALPPQGDERFTAPPWRRRMPSLAAAAARLRREILLRAPGSGARVLVRAEYDVAEMLPALRLAGLRPVSWNGFLKGLPRTGLPLLPLAEVAGQERWFEQCRPMGLDLSAAASGRLAHWWEAVVPVARSVYDAARLRLKEQRVRAVLVPIADSPEETAVVRAALREGIPVTVYQHGGFAGACEYPAWEITDLDQADTMLFYGEGTADFYRDRLARYPAAKARPVAVGSARLEALQRRPRGGIPALRRRLRVGLADSDRLVLYFPTMHTAYTRYLCYGELPDVRHWELQRDILRLFPRGGGARVVYRPFEGFFASPVPRLIAREGLDAVLERAATLADLAEACDAVVCDVPSTGLLEVLLTQKPAFVYADAASIRLTARAEGLLARRAFVAGAPGPFLDSLRRWLSGTHPSADPHDRSFLRAYGTASDDGLSAKRAVAALRVVQ